jgi:hypothetical protein
MLTILIVIYFIVLLLSRLKYSCLRFGLASADYRGLRVHNRAVYTAG